MTEKFKKLLSKVPRFVLYALPMILVFTIVLLAYWPGILVSDSVFQWNQTKTGDITNWHPAYYTMYIGVLTRIIDSPAFVLAVQLCIMSFCIGSFLSKLRKYYNVNRVYLLISSFILALIPLNYNSAVVLLKDSIYSVLLVLLASITLDIINNSEFFSKIKNCIKLGCTFIAIMLMRHNGILVILLYSLVLIIFYYKKKALYIVTASALAVYFLMTTVGFSLFSVREDNYANKYGPISHIYARILNEDKSRLTEEDLEELARFVDVQKLEETFVPCNMDHSINCQHTEVLKEHGVEYLKMAIKEFFEGPRIFIKHYLYMDSYLYSVVPFENYWFVGMFTETDLWVYKDVYPELEENSKLPNLMEILKQNTKSFQEGDIAYYTMWPAAYLYLTLLLTVFLCFFRKNKKIFLVSLIPLYNMLSVAVAMPVGMTRYVYSTFLIAYLFIIWAGYDVFLLIKNKVRSISGKHCDKAVQEEEILLNK